jgi:hypothetical protein
MRLTEKGYRDMASVTSGKNHSTIPGKGKAAYASPRLTTYGNVSELTGGPSAGASDGRSAGAMAMA